jgi:ribosome-binding protein aMBF1 (putative translation factor)
MASHQDFVPVVLKKGVSHSGGSSHTKVDKDEEEIKVPKTYSKEFGLEVSKKRIEMKLTQKELALRSKLDIKTIQDVELGRGIYNGNVISILRRELDIHKRKD